jgi:hypothetical protein
MGNWNSPECCAPYYPFVDESHDRLMMDNAPRTDEITITTPTRLVHDTISPHLRTSEEREGELHHLTLLMNVNRIFLVLSAGEPRGRRAAPVPLDGTPPEIDMEQSDDEDNITDSKVPLSSSSNSNSNTPSVSSSSSATSSIGAFGFGLLPASGINDNNIATSVVDGESKEGDRQTVLFAGTRDPNKFKRPKSRKGRSGVKEVDKDWIKHKKDRQRAQGKKVARDSKYMARRRKPTF